MKLKKITSTKAILNLLFLKYRSYLPTLLSQMGINKCTKRLLLFGPPSLGGLGFTNTWTDQGIAQTQLLLGHLRQGQEIGQLLQVLMETLQMVIG